MKKTNCVLRIAVVIAVVLLAILVSFTAQADDSGKWGNLTWKLNYQGVLTISGTGQMDSFSKGSWRAWLWDRDLITKVIIHEGVTSISPYAFYNCYNMTSITIPKSVKSIGDYAFQSCDDLTTVNISTGVTSIGYAAFNCCDSLKTITIPDSVTSISSYAFCDCDSIQSIRLPSGLKSISAYTFDSCDSLKTVTIPNGPTSIGAYAFQSCGNLQSITIPNSVKTIGNYAFFYCGEMTSITLSSSLTSIGKGAFMYSGLTKVSIPKGVTSLSAETFSGCYSLAQVTLPSGLKSIGVDAFAACYSLETISLPQSITSIGSYAFGGSGLCSISIPSKVLSIKSDTFRACSGLTQVNIPNSVTSIGSEAFFGCSILESISIPGSVRSIGNNAFSHCSSLSSITLTDGLQSIGNNAFEECSELTSIALPGTVKSIGSNVFYKCKKLENLTLMDGMASIGEDAFYSCSSLKSVYIPGSVTTIGKSAFCFCSSLSSVHLSEGIKEIGSLAFANCDNLSSISLPDSVESIGEYAFAFNDKMIMINIPSGLTRIVPNSFGWCSEVTRISIPEGVTTIDGSAFRACSKLTSISIPDSVQSIYGNPFVSCDSLEEIIISPNHPYFEVVNGTLVSKADKRLISATYGILPSTYTVPDGIRIIGQSAFSECTALSYVSVPDSVTSIADEAFYPCKYLKTIAFSGINIDFGKDVIGYDYWSSSEHVTVYCYHDSDPEAWANEEGHYITYLEGTNPNSIRRIFLPGNFRLAVGDTYSFGQPVFPSYDHPSITWSSSNPTVASIHNGTLTALSSGSTTITATVGSVSDTVVVSVYVPIQSFSLSEDEYWLVIGSSYQVFPVDVFPTNADISLIWFSSDENCASVSNNGTVTANNPGDVIISAVTNKGISRSCVFHICYSVTAIDITPTAVDLHIGDQYQLTANVTMRTQSCVNHLVSFTSSDPDVVEVDQTGLVKAKSFGMVNISIAGLPYSPARATVLIRVDVCSVENGEPVPHDWSAPVYIWTDDFSSVTASRTCNSNASHVHTETVATTEEVLIPRTCEETGFSNFTSLAFNCPSFVQQQQNNAVTAALGHKWNTPEYEWAEDNRSITATSICTHDNTHILTEDVNCHSYVISSPTETSAGQFGWKSDPFENEPFVVQTKYGGVLPALNNLNVLYLPVSLTSVEAKAFEGINSQAVVIPSGCTSIGSQSFASCPNLIYVYIPSSIENIADDAFSGSESAVLDIQQ